MKYVREMMFKVVDMGLLIVDEALFTQNANIFLELLSWFAIGARAAKIKNTAFSLLLLLVLLE